MSASTATRDRILDAAMQLFGENGFRGTSVASIERAAGLTPGAGGLYHHFESKDDVLRLGLQRHLARLGALRDIRRLFAGIGDLRVQLTLVARYVLSELDTESELLRILLTEARSHPELVHDPMTTLIDTTLGDFAGWLHDDWGVSPQRAGALASIALGALFSHRLLTSLATAGLDDQSFVELWAGIFERAIGD